MTEEQLREEIKGTVLRPLAHAFGVLARQIDSGEYETPKSTKDAEKITEDLINQAYERLQSHIDHRLSELTKQKDLLTKESK